MTTATAPKNLEEKTRADWERYQEAYNPCQFARINHIGDYFACYRTADRKLEKVYLTNLPAVTTYAKSVREDETPGEARRQLWNLYNDLKTSAAAHIDTALKAAPPIGGDPAELRTAILADYTRAVIFAIGDNEEGGEE